MMALTEPGISILSKFGAFNKAKRRSIVDTVLVQILKEIDEEEDWHDPRILRSVFFISAGSTSMPRLLL
jgi:hypothetical protein